MSVATIPVTLRRSEVLHFLGYPEGRPPPPRVGTLLDEVLEEGRELVRGRGGGGGWAVSEARWVGVAQVEAEGLALGLVTIGPELEGRVDEYLAAGALTRGLLLDAAGSAAVEEAADRLGAELAGEDARGAVTCRLSPGYGRWRLESQAALFAHLPHRQVGVALTPELVMRPHKSISFAMWLGASGVLPEGVAGCVRCTLHTCRYRRSAP